MGRILLVVRLAARDLRRRRAEAALLLLAIMAATTTLTLGLVLHEAASEPYQSTRDATAGPDVIASVGPDPFSGTPADLAGLEALTDAPGVVGHSGPYPMIGAELEAHGGTAGVWAQGRDPADAAVDQPQLTHGSWVRDGGVVVEAGLADALGVGDGDQITVNGRSFQVVGVAATAAATPYPDVCFAPCHFGAAEEAAEPDDPDGGPGPPPPDGPESEPLEDPIDADFLPGIGDTGLVWLTEADARGLAPQAESLSYVMSLKLADPAEAPTFVAAHNTMSGPALATWQDIRDMHGHLVKNQQRVLLTGSWLLGILAVASVAVLVGGRMADQTRRVGLLKAVGGTPSLVAAVLLAEYVIVALLAAAAGLAAGWLGAPLLTDTSASLVGSAGAPSLTMSRIGLVTAVALGVAVIATFVPAVRAARTSTVSALADSARPPRRSAWLIAISARLPVPLLLGLRVAGRRPRRVVLGVVSIAITVSGLVAALAARAQLAGSSGADQFDIDRANQVLLVITVMLVALAAVNTIFITWATALDARHSSALARALGATPHEVSTGLSGAQVLPALIGAILGIPAGIGLYTAVDPDEAPIPPLWWLLAVVLGTVLVVAVLTTIPARLGARRPVAEILQAELA
jgi:ABC-type lipoprotein release transport system permease subunit